MRGDHSTTKVINDKEEEEEKKVFSEDDDVDDVDGDNDDDGEKKKKIEYKLRFIDSYRFMSCKLSDLVDNLSRIHEKECTKCAKEKNQSSM